MPTDYNSKYIDKYKSDHYKRFGMDVSPEVNDIIRRKMEMEGFKSMKDFFYTLFADEYHIDLNRVPDEIPPDK